jgi:hypothetical protein
MDGELRFKSDLGVGEKVKTHRANILETMEESVRLIFEEMRHSGLGFATWEIKSLGPSDVM